MIGIEDLDKSYAGTYYRIHDKDRGMYYYDEWLSCCFIKWLFDFDGYEYPKYL